jgi:hypothetical protein
VLPLIKEICCWYLFIKNEEIYLNYVEVLLLAQPILLAERKLSQREIKQEVSIAREARLKTDYGIK